jgi:hypothetical protein
MTIIHITESRTHLEETLSEMMDVSTTKALSIENLLKAMTKLPLSTVLHFDKIYGRWIFSNQDQDDWPKWIKKAHKVSGVNFTFVDEVPEMALAKGLYYYYHTKLKE